MFGAAQLSRARFYDDLATSLDAGLPARTALSTLGDRADGASLAGLRLETRVAEGSTIADAMAGDPAAWTTFERRVVEAGERGGKLPECLRRLAEHYSLRGFARDRIGLGLLYPIALVHGAFIVLPLYNLFSKGLEAYLRASLLPLGALYALVIAAVLVVRSLRRTEAGRATVDRLALRVPLVSGVVRAVALLEYTSTLAALFASGIPAVEAMTFSASAVRNSVIAAAGARAAERVKAGDRIHEALATEPDMPRLLVEAVRLGETTGKMDESLARIERTARDDADRKVTLVSRAVPVVAYLCAVIFIVYTIFSVFETTYLGPLREASDAMNNSLGR